MGARVGLVVDDDLQVAESHRELLSQLGWSVLLERNPLLVEALLIENPQVELVMLDVRMPGMDGLEILQRIACIRPDIGVIMATVHNDIELAVTAIKSGAYNYLLKPITNETLSAAIDSWLANSPGVAGRFRPEFRSFITQSPLFDSIFKRIESFAPVDVPVLIQGETGTGKEMMARFVHAISARASGAFIPVNVAALSPQLFESELFGHRKGAFTGASSDHEGFLLSVGDGTLFLDEIGELGEEQQKSLLRLLQDGVFNPVGSTRTEQFNGRLVFATNRDLRADIESGRFRDDLYYRISHHAVELPPLRDRVGDIPLLADYFLKKYVSQFGRNVGGFSQDCLAALNAYSFPGNVRELEGIISSAVLLSEDRVVSVHTLPTQLRLETQASEAKDTERYKEVMRVLIACGGNQTKASSQLGMARQTLNKLLKKYREQGFPADIV